MSAETVAQAQVYGSVQPTQNNLNLKKMAVFQFPMIQDKKKKEMKKSYKRRTYAISKLAT